MRRTVAGFIAVVLAIGVPILERPGTADAVGGSLLADFVVENVFGGLTVPTSISFASDGSVFVSEKGGVIKRFDDLADTTPTVVGDLTSSVSQFGERGLLGFRLDPNFPTTPTAYAIYGAKGLVTEQIPPGSTCGSTCIQSGILSRLDWNGTRFVEHQLVHDWCQIFFSHSLDDVAVLPDGSVMASAGDAAFGHFNDTNCPGDPAGQSGSLRAQDILTSGDPISYLGSVIRVDSNGDPTNGTTAVDRIVASGLRNPFRISYSDQTGLLFVSDVGQDEVESIEVVDPDVYANHGWPCWEGNLVGLGWQTPVCNTLPLSATVPALFTYRHNQVDVAPDDAGRCPATSAGNSISGLTHYRGTRGSAAYPTPFRNALFFSDYARGCIWYLSPDASGMPDPTKAHFFASSVGGIIDLEEGPDGSLYLIDVNTSSIRRIRTLAPAPTNLPPSITSVSASPTTGDAPLHTQLSATASDPDGNALTYEWDLDGDGFTDATGASITTTFSSPGAYVATVRVRDTADAVVTQSIPIQVTGIEPILIDAPSTWAVGDTITLGADVQTGSPDTAWTYAWTITLRHCTAGCHEHQYANGSGDTFSFIAPDHEYPTTVEVAVAAVSPTGEQLTATKRLTPSTVSVTVDTSPTGGVIVDSTGSHATPYTFTWIKGASRSLTAPATWNATTTAPFLSWSNGSTGRVLDIAPTADVRLVAQYGAAPCTDRRLEAEAATLTGVQIDTNWKPWSGTGVVGWFETVGDSIAWTVDAPVTGDYRLAWNYASARPSWTRMVEIDGTRVATTGGPTTSAWSTYANTAPVSVNLTAGRHTITLAYRTGNTEYLNIDYLTLACPTSVTPPSTTTTPTTTPTTTSPSSTTSTSTTSTTSTTTSSTSSTTSTSTTSPTTPPTTPPTSSTTSTTIGGTPPTCASPTRYEAETARLTGTQIDTNWKPWSGTGVVGWFDSVGDSIAWTVDVPATGDYRLVWNYASARPSWTRAVEVDGTRVATTGGPTTSAWNVYANTAAVTVTLAAGRHTITLAYRTGNTEYLNIDYLDIACTTSPPATTTSTTAAPTSTTSTTSTTTPPTTSTTTSTTAPPTTTPPTSSTTSTSTTTTTTPPTTSSTTSTTTPATTTTIAGTPPTCVSPSRFEAETARLTGTQIDTNWKPWSGTGVVGWFDTPGDAITWTVTVPATATYQLGFRYASARPAWTRAVEVDGIRIATTGGATTGAWSTYATTVPITTTLTAGTHTITIAYRTGNTEYLNIDYLDLTCTSGTPPTSTTSTTTSTSPTTTPPTTTPPTSSTTSTSTTSTTVPPTTSSTTSPTTSTTTPPTTSTTIGGTPPTCVTPSRLEAETARLTGTQIDTNWKPWSGTGVVGWFDTPGDAITWTVTVPATATYQLGFRYATTRPSWSRSVEIDTTRIATTSGTTTGAWSTYATTVPITTTLTAGTHTITIAYRTGNTEYLNVDYLTLTCVG